MEHGIQISNPLLLKAKQAPLIIFLIPINMFQMATETLVNIEEIILMVKFRINLAQILNLHSLGIIWTFFFGVVRFELCQYRHSQF